MLVAALAFDVILVLIFAATGRSTHDRDNPVLGVLETAWPFLVGLAVGWALVHLFAGRARGYATIEVLPGGVLIWFATVAVGMIIRQLTDTGTAASFIAVAAGFLLITLVGWRVIALLVRRQARLR